jgi:glucose/arabinose dehydrogenase
VRIFDMEIVNGTANQSPNIVWVWGLVAAFISACGGGASGESTTPQTATLPALKLERVFPNVTFNAPLAMLQAPGDDSRWFVVEQGGSVRTFPNDQTVTQLTEFIDISDRVDVGSETGLLGMAFHPQYPSIPQVFLSYTRPGASASQPVSVISRFSSADGGLTLNPGSEQEILTLAQPFPNHNGGHIVFGPDGLFYVGLGDGGSAGDPLGHAQNVTTLFGTLLRVDVDGATPYTIPADNPFAQSSGGERPEIYAWGLRNPWRWSFDRTTGRLWLGDVGQGAWEEVDVVSMGQNYGWSRREGAHCFPPGSSCSTAGLIDPIAEYSHANGRCSITGGYVYRGLQIPDLQGVYLYGDFCSGTLWGLREVQQSAPLNQVVIESGLNISSFGEDVDGELYVVDLNGGLYRIVPTEGV